MELKKKIISFNRLFITVIGFIIVVVLLAFISSPYKVLNEYIGNSLHHSTFPLEQSDIDQIVKCLSKERSSVCPSYFAWIERDLHPWKNTGISQTDIASARTKADFRVVIVNGTLYMERYNKCFESRDDYTLWGLQMLLQEFPGMIPDVDMMLNCGDFPLITRDKYVQGSEKWPPPPLFVYCSTRKEHYDIVLPDWSFWGWPEVNIAPWTVEKEKIYNGSSKLKWLDREHVAYWKGNYWMGPARADLIKCTADKTKNYNLVTYNQNWDSERREKFRTSDLANQCTHRYKVYVEGRAWSVSLKYIMSCGSTVLQIEPVFQEFFARSLVPFVHFWPVNRADICNSIKHAVDWGNANPEQAEAIGKCAQSFLDKELTLDYVYQYMLHLLQAYSRLLKFKPVPPPGVQPMSIKSNLRWHELTTPPPNKTGSRDVCTLPNMTADELLQKQINGYKRIQLV